MNLQPLKKRSRTMLGGTACLLLSACGGVRVVTIPVTEPRQLAEPVKAYVYVETKDGTRIKSSNRAQLYEGEWVLSDPGK
jgi:hypothetical protein